MENHVYRDGQIVGIEANGRIYSFTDVTPPKPAGSAFLNPREVLRHWSLWFGGAGTLAFGFFMFLPQVALWVWASLPWWISAKLSQQAGYVVTFVLLILAGISKFIDQKALLAWLAPKVKTVWQFVCSWFGHCGGNVRRNVAAGVAVLALSAAGAGFVMTQEGVRTTAYQDVADIWTICVGHTGRVVIAGVDYGPVRQGMALTLGQCKVLLQQDSEVARAALNTCVRRPLNQNQSDAMISFTINVGGRAACGSGVVSKINIGDFPGAVAAFDAWRFATVGGVKKPVLRHRRAAEAALFSSPVRETSDTTADNLRRLAEAGAK